MSTRIRRATRSMTDIAQAPFGQRPRPYRPIEVISADQVAAIHDAALKVLSMLGLRVLDPGARERFRTAGAEVAGETVRFDPGFVAERLQTVPQSFTLAARNPAHDLTIGGDLCVYASVGGPAYVMDNDRGRRDGTYEDMCDYMRLVQVLNVVHQEGGGPFEPMDLPAEHPAPRHLPRPDRASGQELADPDARPRPHDGRDRDGGDRARDHA